MLRKGSHKREEFFGSQHRFEHWYRDNSVYFITARCRGRTPAFATETCKSIFWERFNHYSQKFNFIPILVSLLDNHYHVLAYLRHGDNLAPFMKHVHCSVAKLVNDQLNQRLLRFWTDGGHQNYFDGCIRDELQFRRAYRYTLTQCRRHGICDDFKNYPHTRQFIDHDKALSRAIELRAFLSEVPYARYNRRPPR